MSALDQVIDRARAASPRPKSGVLKHVRGPIVRAEFAGLALGALCEIERPGMAPLQAEVTGIEGVDVILCPFGTPDGVAAGAKVSSASGQLTLPCGPGLLGRVVDTFGQPMDGQPSPVDLADHRPLRSAPPSAMDRPLIETVLPLGLRSVDGPMTVGCGQRIGIFGPPGTGKSTFLAMLAQHSAADVTVIGLVGERGREVREFVERDLPADARNRVVVVAATSDRPAIERALCAHSATTVAEYFRDQGKSVLLLIDSLTRTARALREIGLAAGEAPTRRGFPASVYPALPAIIERAGRTSTGDITALYSVLLEDDQQADPIAEEVKSLTDGHFLLSRKLAEKGHYPAIDVLGSLSRCMNAIVDEEHKAAAATLRARLSKMQEIELLLQIGEYRRGSDPDADAAIACQDEIDAFLRQRSDEVSNFETLVDALEEAVR